METPEGFEKLELNLIFIAVKSFLKQFSRVEIEEMRKTYTKQSECHTCPDELTICSLSSKPSWHLTHARFSIPELSSPLTTPSIPPQTINRCLHHPTIDPNYTYKCVGQYITHRRHQQLPVRSGNIMLVTNLV